MLNGVLAGKADSSAACKATASNMKDSRDCQE
jgi:hypothetical protein